MQIKQFAADSVTRTNIIAPRACNNVWLRYDASSMTVRSDPDDASTEDIVPPAVPWAIEGMPPNFEARLLTATPRYSSGDRVASVLLVSGSGFVVGGFS